MKTYTGGSPQLSNASSIHSLRKIRDTKYFADQRGYETDYLKRKPTKDKEQKQKGKRIDSDVPIYLKQSCTAAVTEASSNLDYASEVESKIRLLQAKHLANSPVFERLLTHSHKELMGIHSGNGSEKSTNNEFSSFEMSHQQQKQQQQEKTSKVQSLLTISGTPYKSPQFQSKQNVGKITDFECHWDDQSMQNDTVIARILESSFENNLNNDRVAQREKPVLHDLNQDSIEDLMDIEEIESESRRENCRNMQTTMLDSSQTYKYQMQQQHLKQLSPRRQIYLSPQHGNSCSSAKVMTTAYSKSAKSSRYQKNNSAGNQPPSIQQFKSNAGNSNCIEANSLSTHYLKANAVAPWSTSTQSNNPLTKATSMCVMSDHNNNIESMPNARNFEILPGNMSSGSGMQRSSNVRNKINSILGINHNQSNIPVNTASANPPQNICNNQQSYFQQSPQPSITSKQQQIPCSPSSVGDQHFLSEISKQSMLVQQQQKQIVLYQQQLQQQTIEFQLFLQEQQLLQARQQLFQQQQQQQQKQLLMSAQMTGNAIGCQHLLHAGQQQQQQPIPPIVINNNISKDDCFNPVQQTSNSTHFQQQQQQLQQLHQSQMQDQLMQQRPSQSLYNASQQQSSFIHGIPQPNSTLYSVSAQPVKELALSQNNQSVPCDPQGAYVSSANPSNNQVIQQSFASSFNCHPSNSNNNNNSTRNGSSQRRKWDISSRQATGSDSVSYEDDGLSRLSRDLTMILSPALLQQQQQNAVKKPVKFEIFWEKDEIEHEMKEKEEKERQEKEERDAAAAAVTAELNPGRIIPNSSNGKLQEIFSAKKNELQRRLDIEKVCSQQAVSTRDNLRKDLSKQDLLQIRKELLKPKVQLGLNSANEGAAVQSQLNGISQLKTLHNNANLEVTSNNNNTNMQYLPRNHYLPPTPAITLSSLPQSSLTQIYSPQLLTTTTPLSIALQPQQQQQLYSTEQSSSSSLPAPFYLPEQSASPQSFPGSVFPATAIISSLPPFQQQ